MNNSKDSRVIQPFSTQQRNDERNNDGKSDILVHATPGRKSPSPPMRRAASFSCVPSELPWKMKKGSSLSPAALTAVSIVTCCENFAKNCSRFMFGGPRTFSCSPTARLNPHSSKFQIRRADVVFVAKNPHQIVGLIEVLTRQLDLASLELGAALDTHLALVPIAKQLVLVFGRQIRFVARLIEKRVLAISQVCSSSQQFLLVHRETTLPKPALRQHHKIRKRHGISCSEKCNHEQQELQPMADRTKTATVTIGCRHRLKSKNTAKSSN